MLIFEGQINMYLLVMVIYRVSFANRNTCGNPFKLN
jgi:hypothetical protein